MSTLSTSVTPEVITLVNIFLVHLSKIICIIVGYFTIKFGYRLIEDGVKGNFKFKGELKGIKAGLSGASPGLLFVFLGSILIGYTLHVEKVSSLDVYSQCKKIEDFKDVNIPVPNRYKSKK